jgi:hypothetical protein
MSISAYDHHRLGRPVVSRVIAVAMLLAGIEATWLLPTPAGAVADIATSVRVEADRGHPGPLYARIDGKDVQVAHAAFAAWLVDDGREVAYSGADGAGGYENEGQSLRIYDVRTKASRKVLAARYVIDGVTDVTTRSGERALVVVMRDGGLGASHLAIVAPRRGEVFSRSQVKLLRRQGDVIIVSRYREDDWERMARGISVTPTSTEQYDLDAIVRRAAR